VVAINNNAAGAVYKGLALAGSGKKQQLFAANFGEGRIDVFGGNFSPVSLRAGAFTDPSIPNGFAPFNIKSIGGKLFVTYAEQDALHQNDVPGAGLGVVDVYNTKGALLQKFAASGALDAPWGVTPIAHGHFTGDILIGNFGDGAANVFNSHGQLLGAAQTAANQPLVIPGLWSLTYGAGSGRNTLFFSAGPDGEQHGVFGTLTLLPTRKIHHSTPTPNPTPRPTPTPTPTPTFPYVTRAAANSMNEMSDLAMLDSMRMM
jgi:uncharacterized protein (TIGR03118 family)